MIYELIYKEKRNSRKWRLSSLSMKDAVSCFNEGKKMISENGWDSIAVIERGKPDIHLFSAFNMGTYNTISPMNMVQT